jgi:hypothetical protein
MVALDFPMGALLPWLAREAPDQAPVIGTPAPGDVAAPDPRQTTEAYVESPSERQAADAVAMGMPATVQTHIGAMDMPVPDIRQRERDNLPTLEEMGAPPVLASADPQRGTEDAMTDMPWLSRLPIPALGSVQAAHAASMDIPIPAPRTPPATGQTAFTPNEQSAPLTVPGAPDIPAGIPRGEDIANQPPGQRSAPATPGLPRPTGSGMPVPELGRTPPPEDPNTKAQDLARQQQDILILRQQMDQRLKDLNAAEQKVKEMIREARGIEDQKIRRLIQMYANMKPKMAAKALETMDERVAIRILSGMSPKQSGEILTYTAPEKTAKLTELITRMKLPE